MDSLLLEYETLNQEHNSFKPLTNHVYVGNVMFLFI